MRELAPHLLEWAAAGDAYAVASVVAVTGSAPRRPGAALAVRSDGTVVGSVSGGCVEGAVYELAQEVLASGTPELAHFGYSDEDAFAVGLTCGGELDVFVQAVPPPSPGVPDAFTTAHRAVCAGHPAALARVISGPGRLRGRAVALVGGEPCGTTGDPGLDAAILSDARARLDSGRTGVCGYGARDQPGGQDVRVLIESWPPPARLLVFGSTDYASTVATIGAFLGYRVTMCDARAVFTTEERFPTAHELVVDWPHRYLTRTETDRRTAVCVATHDPKFDIPLLAEALRKPLAYVGALGSRRVHTDRLRRLREAGLTDEQLARLRSPVGLDIGALTPEETAVAIAAELIAARSGGSGRPLSAVETPIHPEAHPLAQTP
ncbi:XdhC family protein [Streptomyces acidicola]|uniref:XdhC family protein n=1 Tax=Streptomyces acidicola TaxID=2596892 RepID=UPI0038028962